MNQLAAYTEESLACSTRARSTTSRGFFKPFTPQVLFCQRQFPLVGMQAFVRYNEPLLICLPKILSSLAQHPKAGRRQIYLRPTQHDSRTYDSHEHSPIQFFRSGSTRNGGTRRLTGGRTVYTVHGEIRHGSDHDARRSAPPILERKRCWGG